MWPEHHVARRLSIKPEGRIQKKEAKKLQNFIQLLLKLWVMIKLSETQEENADREKNMNIP